MADGIESLFKQFFEVHNDLISRSSFMFYDRESSVKKKLMLKDVNSSSESTKRIFDLTRKTCENFNNYYLDFFESISILSENREHGKGNINEIAEQISFIETKIDELAGFMRDVVDRMGDFVELVDVD